MSAKTSTPAKRARRELTEREQNLLTELNEVGDAIFDLKEQLTKLMVRRNKLFARGRKMNLSFTQIAEAAGVRRETAHHALRTAENGTTKEM